MHLCIFALCCVPLPLPTFYAAVQSLISRYRNGYGDVTFTRLGLLAAVVVFAVLLVLAWLLLLKPWAIFPQPNGDGGYAHGWNHYSAFQLYYGGYATILLPALITVYVVVANRLMAKPELSLKFTRPTLQPLERHSYCSHLCTLLVILVLAFFATFFFSPVINYSPQSYFPSQSPYSLISISAGSHFVTKVYKDTIVYYSVMIGVVLLGALAHTMQPLRSLLHRRMRFPGNPSSMLHPFPHGVSIGELLLVCVGLFLFGFWLYFWRWDYARIENEAALDKHRQLHIWARVFGHLTSLSFSLLLLPAARNSMWVACFGVPFERAVRYHRFLGSLAYLLVTVHMLIWFVKWGIEGTLLNNMFHIDNLILGDTVWVDKATCTGFYPHWDNFTIPLTWIGWLGLTVMVSIAMACRRKNYELFHYIHHFAWVYYIIALMHAWTFWYYAVGGLTLYLVDRCIRLTRACTHTAIVSLGHHDGVSILHIAGGTLQYHAGQYAFVNVPAISELQWHPFTISSPPDASELSFHIKNMGDKTWTGELAALASHQSMTEVRIDGPYGKPHEYSSKSVLVLLAGGIGITPMHAVFAEVYAHACRSLDSDSIGRIRVRAWAVVLLAVSCVVLVSLWRQLMPLFACVWLRGCAALLCHSAAAITPLFTCVAVSSCCRRCIWCGPVAPTRCSSCLRPPSTRCRSAIRQACSMWSCTTQCPRWSQREATASCQR